MKPAGKEGKPLRAVSRIPRRPPGMERIPLSGVQMQMWFLDQLVPGSPRRHEILRTAYVYADGAPWQVVTPAAIDDAGIGPFETVPADGVSDDLLRCYLRMWAPEVGELS